MKAKIYYRVLGEKATTKTIEVAENEPNSIIREFIKLTGLRKNTYVSHIKCGRYDYQWAGDCWGSFDVC